MSRRALIALAIAFVLLRVTVVLSSADRISEPDSAETKLMELGDRWVRDGAPSLEEVTRLARAGRNAPHGGAIPTSLAYAALTVPTGIVGSIAALKLVAVAGATAGFVCWVLAAARLAGPLASWALALLLLLPPPALLGGQLVAWGSHSEVPWLLGGLALLTTRRGPLGRGEPLLIGLAAGLCAGFDLLAAPLAAALLAAWTLDRCRTRRAWGAWAAMALVMALALAWTGALSASLTEQPGNTAAALLGDAARRSLLGPSLRALIPLPFVGPASGPADAVLWINGALSLSTLALLGTAVISAPTWRGRIWALAPLAFLVLLAATAPRAPAIPARYLLPAWPLLLAGASIGAASLWQRWRAARPAVVGAVTALLGLGATTLAPLVAPGRAAGFWEWDPARYTAADLGHVGYELAAPLGRVLDALGPRVVLPDATAPSVPGLAAVLGTGSADCLLLDGAARRTPGEIAQAIERGPGLEPVARRAFFEQVGWGLALNHRDRRAERLALLSRLSAEDRGAAEAGEAWALTVIAR